MDSTLLERTGRLRLLCGTGKAIADVLRWSGNRPRSVSPGTKPGDVIRSPHHGSPSVVAYWRWVVQLVLGDQMSIVREAYTSKWMWVLTGTVIGAVLTGGLSYRQHRAHITEASASNAYCENGIGAAKAHTASALATATGAARTAAVTQTTWIPKINDTKPPKSAPVGMAWIPGGQFWMGTTEDHMTDARPWHRVYVDGYWIDKTE